jgi:hypothetical protein
MAFCALASEVPPARSAATIIRPFKPFEVGIIILLTLMEREAS